MTHQSRFPRITRLIAVGGALALLSLAPTTFAASVPEPSPIVLSAPQGGVPANQIIMRDGGVCDPIRHMGC